MGKVHMGKLQKCIWITYQTNSSSCCHFCVSLKELHRSLRFLIHSQCYSIVIDYCGFLQTSGADWHIMLDSLASFDYQLLFFFPVVLICGPNYYFFIGDHAFAYIVPSVRYTA
ncbi:hypothetical protein Dimus_039554 [Dionaea muscipula]